MFIVTERDQSQIPNTIVYDMKHTLKPEFPFPGDALPRDIASQIQSFHGLPVAWWQGQLIKYILRPVDGLVEKIKKVEEKLGFESPIVGYVFYFH